MKKIIVSKSGKLKTICDALLTLKINEEAIIEVDQGIYNEKIKICNSNVTIKGKGIDKTIIMFDDYSKKIHIDKRDYNTFRTSTLLITGDNCSLENLSIKNTSIDPKCGQAVALSVLGNKFKATNVKLSSGQDTLFLGPLPDDLKDRYMDFLPRNELFIEGSLFSIFKNCIIEGHTDFIFGSGSALFDNCKIISTTFEKIGYIVAPSHSMFQKVGFVFKNCSFINDTNNANSVYLLRFWRPFGISYFLNCSYESHIIEEGFTKWNNRLPDIYTRIYEYPRINGRVSWLNNLSEYEYQKINRILEDTFKF